MRRHSLGMPALLLGVCVSLAAGCSSSPVPRFYVLSALPAQAGAEAGRELAVGVGPLDLPEYLDRPQIVTRTGQNELKLAEFDRWGETLKDNAADVLAENLAILLPSKKISVYPWKRSMAIDYQVAVRVVRFDRADGGEAVLVARWNVLDGNGKVLHSQESRYAENPAGTDFAATVAALNRAWAQFSREVARAVNGLKAEGSPAS